ncbi:MAG TPA: hypothetical protein VJB91_00250 [Patescibacteria group bacterium]|nr:hypothetical protein [Patescibacteria group bacterium]
MGTVIDEVDNKDQEFSSPTVGFLILFLLCTAFLLALLFFA